MTDSCPAAADRIDPNAARKKTVITFRVLPLTGVRAGAERGDPVCAGDGPVHA